MKEERCQACETPKREKSGCGHWPPKQKQGVFLIKEFGEPKATLKRIDIWYDWYKVEKWES